MLGKPYGLTDRSPPPRSSPPPSASLHSRRQRYPGYIARRRLSRKAAHEIACLEAIIEDYRAAAERERLL